jgi:hypothetical protein
MYIHASFVKGLNMQMKADKLPIEEQGRFLAFMQEHDRRFLTKAASAMIKSAAKVPEPEQQNTATFRFRAYPTGRSLPDLYEGDIFTLNGIDYTIMELHWGYKGWVKRQVLRASEIRKAPRSKAVTVAFAVCSFT